LSKPAQVAEESPDDLLTIEQASQRYGLAKITLRRYADAGKLPVSRTPGNHRRFRRSDLDTLLAAKH
jgi:excisionase family DNA binding protein